MEVGGTSTNYEVKRVSYGTSFTYMLVRDKTNSLSKIFKIDNSALTYVELSFDSQFDVSDF
jgi:hypothetical protein